MEEKKIEEITDKLIELLKKPMGEFLTLAMQTGYDIAKEEEKESANK